MSSPPIVLYDARCGVCHWAVRFVLRNDQGDGFMFAGVQSTVGRKLLALHHVSEDVDSIVVIHRDVAFVRSDAVLAILRNLGGVWRVSAAASLLPRVWRDAMYDAFARRREALSRRFALACELPAGYDRRRFLDADEWAAQGT